MILTDKGNRKPVEEKKPTYGFSTFEELEERVKSRFEEIKPGLEFVKSMGCECGIKLPQDVVEGTKQEIWFFENSTNHDKECMYIFISSL